MSESPASPPGASSKRPAAARGQRLAPRRGSRIYWHLSCLRAAMVRVSDLHVAALRAQRLLDYGCGNMPYRPLLEPHVGEYIGCDLSGNELADRIMESIDVLPVEAGSCDIVLSTQVLEHVPNPTAYLAEARRVLREGGTLVLSTHGVWRYHPDPTDFWRWTRDGLVKVISDAGFEVVECRGIMAPASYALQLFQDAVLAASGPRRLGRVYHRILRPAFILGMQGLIELADRMSSVAVRDSDACVYVVVARLPSPNDRS